MELVMLKFYCSNSNKWCEMVYWVTNIKIQDCRVIIELEMDMLRGDHK